MMDENYDWDIFEIFKEQVEIQLPRIEQQILLLEDKDAKSDAIDEIFRAFHSYKPNADYLQLQPFYELVTNAENILSVLREDTKLVSESIIEWLLQIIDQLTLWVREMEEGSNLLSPFPPKLLNQIQVSNSYVKPVQRLQKLTVLYVDINTTRAEKVSKFLSSIAKSCTFREDIPSTQKYLQNNKINIIIMNLGKENFTLIKQIKEISLDIHTIAVFNKVSSLTLKQLLKYGISHTAKNPLNPKSLQRELLSIVKIFFSSRTVVINHKKISSFIQTLQPLSNTIMQIMQICDDEEIPVKDLIKVVKTDPIIAANILNIANSPLYGSVQLKTIDLAVSKFGKRVIKALAMNGLYKSLGDVNLEAYNISEDTFSKVSMNRLSLMLKWYAKVNIADLTVLSSTALLGNIGQLLIAKEIKGGQNVEEFQNLIDSVSIKYAEEALVHTTTNIISSQILNYWKLSKDVVDIIAYSDIPSEAPEELQKLAVANHIVYSLVNGTGEIATEISDNTLLLMANHGFDPKPLQNALESLHKANQ